MKAVTPTLGICILAVAAAVIAAIGDFGGSSTPSKVYGGAPTVAIQDFKFTAAVVPPGADVTVTNLDSAPHTVSADDGAFDSDVVDAGASGQFTAPSQPGTYAIHCNVHPSMTGTLVVATP